MALADSILVLTQNQITMRIQ